MRAEKSLTARAVHARLPRAVALLAHRYVGLVLSLFLLVAGLTGSVLAFKHELEGALSPDLFRVHSPSPEARPRAPLELRGALEAQLPAGAQVTYVPLVQERDEAMLFFAEPSSESDAMDDEFFVNPYTGELLGSRTWGAIDQGVKNLIPFVYRLHFSLALGTVGSYLFGVIALLWTVDCFVGAYLTFPPRRKLSDERRPSAWLVRWKPSWLLKSASLFSFVFTWHRASGLWVWGMLLVFAWSAVGMNLTEIYNPVMHAAFGMQAPAFDRLPRLPRARHMHDLSWDDALEKARDLMRKEASRRDFEVLQERGLAYHAELGMFQYRVRSALDVSDRYPSTVIWLDGNTGQLAAFEAPTGQRGGDTITAWINQLHFGAIAVGGLPYRMFVSLMGVLVALLSITGLWVWWRKRTRRADRKASSRVRVRVSTSTFRRR